MRHIQFRGQYSQGIENAGCWVYWGLGGTDALDAIDHSTIGQFTGLLDKNGVEIYEGDVVRILYTDWISKGSKDPRTIEEYMRDIALIGEIIFDTDCCGVRFSKKHQTQTMLPGRHGYIEVIGNIYENSDLLAS